MKVFNSIDAKEAEAAFRACRAYPLSGYLGSRDSGGPQCIGLENEWCMTFSVNHSIGVNSATSGLLAACMAVGIEHGDEVIVSPYTMSATAAAPAILGAKIIFADIEAETFCIDTVEVSNAITRKTKAVIATNLFGHPARLHELRALCDSHGVYLIEDNAQAIFAKENGKYTGTIGHIGVFSLNVHKHLQVGEGGICCTNSNLLAKLLREAMNHGEMRGGILGLNLRMTEVTAAMAREQLKKAGDIIKGRWTLQSDISWKVKESDIPIGLPVVKQDCQHTFYCWAGLMESEPKGEIPAPFKRGYMHPLYSLPAFKQTSLSLPVVEEVERRIIILEICSIDPTDAEIKQMVHRLGEAL